MGKGYLSLWSHVPSGGGIAPVSGPRTLPRGQGSDGTQSLVRGTSVSSHRSLLAQREG